MNPFVYYVTNSNRNIVHSNRKMTFSSNRAALLCAKPSKALHMLVPCFCFRIPVSSLVDSWPSLLALLKDSVQLGLPAPGQFLILGLVSLTSILLHVPVSL